MKKGFAFTFAFFFISVFMPSTALAQTQGYIDWPETWRQWNELQNLNRQWWNSLSQRQQYLVRAVDSVGQVYTQQTGNSCIPVNQQNLNVVMHYIGATPAEAPFVHGRMQKFCEVESTLRMGEDVISDIERQIQCGFRPECYR